MLTEAETRHLVRTEEPDAICRNYIFSDDAWIFRADSNIVKSGTYADFKNLISAEFGSAPNNVVLVGSAKLGRSLNPDRAFKTFNQTGSSSGKKSDLDVVIVNDRLFHDTWRALLSEYYKGRIRAKDHSNEIFRRFVSLSDDKDYGADALRDITVQMREMRRNVQMTFRLDHVINYRIYQAMDDAFAYHKYGLGKLKESFPDA